MFEAGARNEELPRAFELHMRRGVQRVFMQTPILNGFSLLLRRHFPIVVNRARTLENRRTEYNLQVASASLRIKPGILYPRLACKSFS
jgi:hypothetical protein